MYDQHEDTSVQQIKVIRTAFRHFGRRNVIPIHSEEWGIFVCLPAREVDDDTQTPVDIAVEMLQENAVQPSYHLFQEDLHYFAPSGDDEGNGEVDFFHLDGFSVKEQQEIFERITGIQH